MSSQPSSIEGRSTDRWCITEFYESKINFTWKIKNFPLCTKDNGQELKSSTFDAPNKKSQWCMEMYPKGDRKEYEEYISLYLTLVSSEEPNLTACFKLYLYDKYMGRKYELNDCIPKKFDCGSVWGYPKFLKRDELLKKENGLLSGSTLNIGCDVYIREPPLLMSGVGDPRPPVVKCDLSRNLGDLFHSQKYCDVVLNVNGKKFNCHKAILAARSPVFCAMFGHEMQENDKNEVFITDADQEVVEVLLQYFYTGEAKDLDKFASTLMVLSDKYDLPRLKAMCEEHLVSKLSTETAIDILLLAHNHNSKTLRKSAIGYFASDEKAIMSTPKWESISTLPADLLKELFDASTTHQSLGFPFLTSSVLSSVTQNSC